MTLYLKYRPQKIEELDLTGVRNSLLSFIKSDNIPHAFLFAGPRGTGKTSAARILAKALNCEKNKDKLGEPCNRCEQCIAISKGQHMDVVELDTASHRGIDDIRSLRQSVALSPSRGRKKVYILDEAHMLTLEAANAFLKTLEEPPAHVVFILATTDPQKLPITVRSRLSLVQFNRATDEEIKRQLGRVSKGEKLQISDEALQQIVPAADGSFRDAVKIVESLAKEGKQIDKNVTKAFLGGLSNADLSKLFDFLYDRNTPEALAWVSGYVEKGGDCKLLGLQIISSLRAELLAVNGVGERKFSFSPVEVMKLLEIWLEAQSQMRFSPVESLPLEIAIVKYSNQVTPPTDNKRNDETKPTADTKKNGHVKKPAPKVRVDGKLDESAWQRIVMESKNNMTIEALLRAASPIGFDGENLQIGVCYRFHKEQLETQKNRMALEKIIGQVLGVQVKVLYELVERKSAPIKKDLPLTATKDNDIIEAAKEIFA